MLLHCWWECKLVQPLWISLWDFSENLESTYLKTQQYLSWAYTQKVFNNTTRKFVPLPFLSSKYSRKALQVNTKLDIREKYHCHLLYWGGRGSESLQNLLWNNPAHCECVLLSLVNKKLTGRKYRQDNQSQKGRDRQPDAKEAGHIENEKTGHELHGEA